MIPFNERTLNIDAGPKCTLQCSACARQRFAEQNRRIPGKDLTPEPVSYTHLRAHET